MELNKYQEMAKKAAELMKEVCSHNLYCEKCEMNSICGYENDIHIPPMFVVVENMFPECINAYHGGDV